MKNFLKGFIDAHKSYIQEMKENWKSYLLFMCLVIIHSAIAKTDPYLSGAILFVSFITTIVITVVIAFVQDIRSKNENPH